MSRIKAPFTPEQIEALNRYQTDARYHAFTCGRNRTDAAHRAYAEARDQSDYGILVATRDGWECPVCGYTQDWAHGFMLELGNARKAPEQ